MAVSTRLYINRRQRSAPLIAFVIAVASALAGTFSSVTPVLADHALTIDRAEWRNDGNRLRVEGHTSGERDTTVTLTVRGPDGSVVLTRSVGSDEG